MVSPLSNIYFTVPSSIFLAALITWVMEKWVAPRVEGLELDGPRAPGNRRKSSVGTAGRTAAAGSAERTDDAADSAERADEESMDLSSAEKRGVRNALIALLAFLSLVAGAVAIPGSPLRGEDGGILTGPALMHVSILIAIMFVVLGVAYGATVGTVTWAKLPEFMVNGMKDVAPSWSCSSSPPSSSPGSNGPTSVPSWPSPERTSSKRWEIATPLLFIGVILMTFLLNLFITSGSAQWTLMAPVIVPAMMLLNVALQS